MVASVQTVSFEGIEARPVEVQVQIAGGLPAFTVVGLPDKAVTEARERVRASLLAIGLSLPPERITVNLSPADQPKEGSHYDLPIALAILVAMGAVPSDATENVVVMGELGLDGSLRAINGALPAAIYAGSVGKSYVCPAAVGPEAAWAGSAEVIAPESLLAFINHIKGRQVLSGPEPTLALERMPLPDLRDIKGQETAVWWRKRTHTGFSHFSSLGIAKSTKVFVSFISNIDAIVMREKDGEGKRDDIICRCERLWWQTSVRGRACRRQHSETADSFDVRWQFCAEAS